MSSPNTTEDEPIMRVLNSVERKAETMDHLAHSNQKLKLSVKSTLSVLFRTSWIILLCLIYKELCEKYAESTFQAPFKVLK